MITMHLSGGLGNQMFQFATGYSLAKNIGVNLCLNLSTYVENIRSYELDNFEKINKFCQYDYKIPVRNRVLDLLKKYSFLRGDYIERHPFKFSDSIAACCDGVNLYGYFQSEKYFSSHREDLLDYYNFSYCADSDFNRMLDLIQHSDSVSVHIRRGDYLTNPAAKAYHGILPIDYYKEAAQIISNRIPNPVYFIFSDDLDWAGSNLKFLQKKFFVDCNRGKKSYRDIQLMSICHSNIIANSSFSWWGAWLNKNEKKIVIAPKKWVAAKGEPLDDVVPFSWITI